MDASGVRGEPRPVGKGYWVSEGGKRKIKYTISSGYVRGGNDFGDFTAVQRPWEKPGQPRGKIKFWPKRRKKGEKSPTERSKGGWLKKGGRIYHARKVRGQRFRSEEPVVDQKG